MWSWTLHGGCDSNHKVITKNTGCMAKQTNRAFSAISSRKCAASGVMIGKIDREKYSGSVTLTVGSLTTPTRGLDGG